MSLYRKYRPGTFAHLVGQDHIRQTLLNEIQSGHMSHAYLFAGPRGTGKTSAARLIAKALNCTNRSELGEPCESCELCVQISEGSLIDVIEVDAASNRGIDEIRELREKINFAPTRAKSKTYIIDEVHMLTKEAFNALLKTLEEPPENVYFILCTTELHKIPETIISRCQKFDFKRIDLRTIMTRLHYIAQKEEIEVQDGAIDLIARYVEGGMRDAIGLLEQLSVNKSLQTDHVRLHLGITGHQTIEEFIELLEQKETARALRIINQVYTEGYDLSSFLRELLEELRTRMINGVQQGQAHIHVWMSYISNFEVARDMLRTSIIPQLPLEIATIKCCETDQIAAQMEQKPPVKKENPAPQQVVEKIKAAPEAAPVEMKSTPEAVAGEESTAQNIKQEFEMERFLSGDLAAAWPRILEHVDPPSLRRSLNDATLSSNELTIELTFRSKFYMEKVGNAENLAKLEAAAKKVTNTDYKIICKVSPAAMSLSTEPSSRTNTKPAPEKKSDSPEPTTLTDKAMEIFGSDDW